MIEKETAEGIVIGAFHHPPAPVFESFGAPAASAVQRKPSPTAIEPIAQQVILPIIWERAGNVSDE
jgi:hypothetical protein